MANFSKIEMVVLAFLVGFTMIIRMAHLGGDRLDITSWRQADTAYMAYRMMDENPPELLHPKAPFRGAEDVKAAEFPVYPFLVSLAYKAAGKEDLGMARTITLFIFLLSVYYLFKAVEITFSRPIAFHAAALYMVSPLAIFFSRAVHPDYLIILCSHAFWYFGLRFFRDGTWKFYFLAVLFATLAFLMKAPYCFYFGLPLAVWAIFRPGGLCLRNLAALGFVFVIPLAAAMWFNEHRIALEANHTESLAYPMKWTAESSFGRFFGTLDQRFDMDAWLLMAKRLPILIWTPLGCVLALGGLFMFRDRASRLGRWCLWSLAAGVLLYVLLVFPMVTGGHNYYSLPLLAPGCILMAGATRWLLTRKPMVSAAAAVVLVLGLGWGAQYGLARGPYLYTASFFDIDWQRSLSADVIRSQTQPEDLVISVIEGRSTGWSDPKILYEAKRRGWSIMLDKVDAETLNLYLEHGATKAALLLTPNFKPEEEHFGVFGAYPHSVYEMTSPDGVFVGWTVVFDLSRESRGSS